MNPLQGFLVDPMWKSCFASRPFDSTIKLRDTHIQCQIVFSLLIHLNLPLRDFLLFIFSSDLVSVKQRAGMFLSHNPNNKHPFLPSTLYELWHDRFPKSRVHLHNSIIKACAHEMVLDESDNLINNKAYKLDPRTVTITSICDTLHPGKLAAMYEASAPFTWSLLETFATSPNRHRKRLQRQDSSASPSASPVSPGGDHPFEGKHDDENSDESDSDNDKRFNGESHNRYGRGFLRNPTFTLVFALSMMAFTRNSWTNLFPTALGLFLEIGGTSARVLSTLSNAGACISVSTIERLKKILSDDAKRTAVDLMQSSTLYFVIFDNINIFLRKSQQRLFNKNSMIHATNAAVIAIPDVSKEAEDLASKLANRGKRSQATGEDILPTSEDEQKMLGSFEGLVSHLIIGYCPGSRSWSDRGEMVEHANRMMAKDRPLAPEKTDARPLGVFDVNEGSKKGIIDMLKEIQETSGLSEEEWSSKTRIIAGDWLTTSNFRSARKDRANDINSMERLEYVEDLSQLFHFALNASHMLMRLHFGNAILDPGSLAKHKGLLNRTWDASKPNYADGKALIRHSLIARILYSLMIDQKFEHWSDLERWKPTPSDLSAFSSKFVRTYAATTKADEAKDVQDDYLAHSIYFIRDALIFCEFEHAVSHADAGRVLRVLKFWALSFRGAGLHNYSRECLELLIRWKYELDSGLKQAMEKSWFVNRWGKPGRWIAADLYVEQLNYWVKRVFIAKGSGVTLDYIIEKGSASVEAFREISHQFSRTFGHSDRARRHKEVSIDQDLRLLCEEMLRSRLHILTPNRQILSEAKVNRRGNITTPPKSMIFDSFDVGSESLNGGKFSDFIQTTCWDPAVGYPVDAEAAAPISETVEVPGSGTAYDSNVGNPISIESFNDIDDGDDFQQRCPGFGGLGGGAEL